MSDRDTEWSESLDQWAAQNPHRDYATKERPKPTPPPNSPSKFMQPKTIIVPDNTPQPLSAKDRELRAKHIRKPTRTIDDI